MKISLTACIGLFVFHSLWAAESLPVQGSSSPDNHFRFELLAPEELGAIQNLQLVDTRSKNVLVTIPIGGYASFPHTARKENLTILWSPKASYVAIGNRGTKRTWNVRIYSFDGTTLTPVDIPDLTQFSLKQIHHDQIFRYARETPVRWIDDQSIVIAVAGDCGDPPEVIEYDGELFVDASSGKVTISTPLATRKEEG